MISSPYAPKCSNWSRGCLGTAGDLGEPMFNTCTPGSLAFLEGQRAGALSHERRRGVPPGRDATKPPGSGGRFGGQHPGIFGVLSGASVPPPLGRGSRAS